MAWSNCLFWALPRFIRLKRAWKREGMPPGREPYIVIRHSRSAPRWIPHILVGRYDEWNDQLALESFKPTGPTDEPWWRAWTHLLFRGNARVGDFPDTRPERK